MSLFGGSKAGVNNNGSRNRELQYHITCPKCKSKTLKEIWTTREGRVNFTCYKCSAIFEVMIPGDLKRNGEYDVSVIKGRCRDE